MLSFAKQFVTVSGKKFIEKIADKARNNNEYVEHCPNTAKISGNFQNCGRMYKCPFIFDQNNGIRFLKIVFFYQLLTVLALQRSKSEIVPPIMPKDEIYRTMTEIAYAIEKNNCAHNGLIQAYKNDRQNETFLFSNPS